MSRYKPLVYMCVSKYILYYLRITQNNQINNRIPKSEVVTSELRYIWINMCMQIIHVFIYKYTCTNNLEKK